MRRKFPKRRSGFNRKLTRVMWRLESSRVEYGVAGGVQGEGNLELGGDRRAMTGARRFAVVFACCSILCVGECGAETNRFTFCSRILSAVDKVKMNENSGSKGVGASGGDPIACKAKGGEVPLKNGLQASSCQETIVDLTGSDSSFARQLDVGGKSGSLNAFKTNISFDGGVLKRTVCFKHDVPMGSSELSDDSPRCFRGNNQPFLMFVTKTCPPHSNRCTTHWLLAIDGKCNGSPINQLATVQETNGNDDGKSGTGGNSGEAAGASKTRKLPSPAVAPELSNVPLPPVAKDR